MRIIIKDMVAMEAMTKRIMTSRLSSALLGDMVETTKVTLATTDNKEIKVKGAIHHIINKEVL